MPLPLSRDHVAERLRNYTHDNYIYLGSIIKGVALAAAALAGLNILSDLNTYWPIVAPWFASFLAITVSHMTWSRGVWLANARSNLWDSVIPLVMGLVEFALFGILIPNNEHPLLWRYWFLILALHALSAVLIVRNRMKNTVIEEDFDHSLHGLATEHMKDLRGDRFGAFFACVSSRIVWLILIALIWPLLPQLYADLIQTFLAVLASAFLCKPIRDSDNQRRRMDEIISQRGEAA